MAHFDFPPTVGARSALSACFSVGPSECAKNRLLQKDINHFHRTRSMYMWVGLAFFCCAGNHVPAKYCVANIWRHLTMAAGKKTLSAARLSGNENELPFRRNTYFSFFKFLFPNIREFWCSTFGKWNKNCEQHSGSLTRLFEWAELEWRVIVLL